MNPSNRPRPIFPHTMALALAFASIASAAEPTPAPPQKPQDLPLLSFAGGKVIFDVQEHMRAEVRDNNFDFNSAVNAVTDDAWLLQRFRIGMMLKAAPWLRIYAQGQDSREWFSDRADIPGVLGAEGNDPFDLRQAYIEIANYDKCPWGLKVGRQILSYGDERLIGSFEWNNIGRTFDALKLSYQTRTWHVDAFASSVVNIDRGNLDQSDVFNGNETHREQILSGIHASTSALDFQSTDLYVLHLHQNGTAGTGDTNFVTLGTRVKSTPGKFAGFDYDGEFAFQTGKVRGLDLTAGAVHVGGGYTFAAPWKPRLGLEYNFGTGDRNPADGSIETFQNLFPTNHKFYGYMDVFSWQNMHNLGTSFKVAPLKTLALQADFHAFWLATTDDVWYRANGTTAVRPLNAASRAANNYAGSEVDLTVTWKARKELQIQAGYSHFFAGSYLGNTGASDDANFGYVQATLSF